MTPIRSSTVVPLGCSSSDTGTSYTSSCGSSILSSLPFMFTVRITTVLFIIRLIFLPRGSIYSSTVSCGRSGSVSISLADSICIGITNSTGLYSWSVGAYKKCHIISFRCWPTMCSCTNKFLTFSSRDT